MADLVQYPNNVQPVASPKTPVPQAYVCGEAIVGGNAVYQSSSDSKIYKAVSNDTAAKANAIGIAAVGGAAGQSVPVYKSGSQINLGAGANEVQTITIDATGGTFTITYSGQTTSALAYNASAAAVQAALEALSNLAPGDVVVTLLGAVYTLTFGGTLAYTNVAAVTTDATSLTGGASTATVATVTQGSPRLTVGKSYIVSNTAGAIAPVEDLSSGEFSTILGIAKTTSELYIQISASGVQVA